MRYGLSALMLLVCTPAPCLAVVVNRAEISYQLGAAFLSSSNTVTGANSATLPPTSVDTFAATASVRGEVNPVNVFNNLQKMSATTSSFSSVDLPFAASARITETWRDTMFVGQGYGVTYVRMQVHGIFRADGSQPTNMLAPPDWPGNASASVTINGSASTTWTSVNGAVPTPQNIGWAATFVTPNADPYVYEFRHFYNLALPASPSPTSRDFTVTAQLLSTARNGVSSANMLATIGIVDVLDENFQSIAGQVSFASGLQLAAVPEASALFAVGLAAVAATLVGRRRKRGAE